jgi:hypothetical protein
MAWGPGSTGGSPYDGRLDLDDLDLVTSLEVVGEDQPTLSENVADALRRLDARRRVSEHRAVAAGVVVAVVAATVGAGAWWVTRPEPLPDTAQVRVLVSAERPDAELLPSAQAPTSVAQRLDVTTSERPGVEVAVALTGPGLREPGESDAVVVGRAGPQSTLVASAALDCTAPLATDRALSATPDDYALVVRRTAPEGETRTEPVPFAGAASLADSVRRACMQVAADRDLLVRDVAVVRVARQIAVDVDVTLTADAGAPVWRGLRTSPAATPSIVSRGADLTLEPGATGHLVARIWPFDCSRPSSALDDGLPLVSDLGLYGLARSSPPVLSLALPVAAQSAVDEALRSVCGTQHPRILSMRADLRQGSSGTNAGVVDLDLRLDARDATLVDATVAGALVPGGLEVRRTQVPVRDGEATLSLRWTLPTCTVVQRSGTPQVTLTLVGDERRPYLLDLVGDGLRSIVTRLCGDEVASLVAG